MKAIEHRVIALFPELISWRRHLHQFPELSFNEYRTTDYIESTLQQFENIVIKRLPKTGLVGYLHGNKPGKSSVIAIRADIDALPLQERSKLPFSSKIPGVMHACGHDGHTAILLGLSKLLSSATESFCGEVRLIFQHAEELPPGGAIDFVRAGLLNDVDVVLGLHLSTNWDTGKFGIKSGVLTAAVDRFDINLIGKGGHCAFPEQCNDPVISMAELILGLQTIVSRSLSPFDPAVVSICEAHTGTAYNIIPEKATITASVRSFSHETRKLIEKKVRQIAEGIAQANDISMELLYEHGYPSVENHPELTVLAKNIIESRFGINAIELIDSIMPGEDFGYFLDGRPGFFVELGSRNVTKSCNRPHHNSAYMLDEDALLYGVQYMLDMLRNLMNGDRIIIDKCAMHKNKTS